MRSKRSRCGCGFHDDELGLGSVKLSQSFGRKRILMSRTIVSLSDVEIPSLVNSSLETTIVSSSSEKSPLESLLPDLLVKVICGVDHEDLESLILVSKTIKEASLIAKREHFAYNTPKKNRRNPRNLEENSNWNHREDDDDDIEPPNAPIRNRWTKAKRKEQLESISVELFK